MLQIHGRIRPLLSSSEVLLGRQFSTAASTKRKWSVDRTTGVVSSSADEDTNAASAAPSTYQTIIGLEIHCRLTSCPTKLFSSSPNAAALPSSSTSPNPNELISPFDLAHPGTLPRISQACVQHAILSTAALNCTVNPVSRFERKHYFWHDLPHGYQITQQRWPIGGAGVLRVQKGVGSGGAGGDNKSKKKKGKKNKTKDDGASDTRATYEQFFDVGIDRIQLEIDTAKTTSAANNPNTSLINLNRAGAPLIEIVFAPTIRSASQAADAVETVRRVLKYAGTCNGRMEEGNLRVDLNVSMAKVLASDTGNEENDKVGTTKDAVEAMYSHYLPPNVGPRTEVKNLNSLRQVVASAEYEALRQVQLAEEYAAAGEQSSQQPGKETRTFDPRTQRTVKIRDKGGAIDYRFLPEPDLPPVVLNSTVLDGHDTVQEFLSTHLPESPDSALERLILEYGLEGRVARVICAEPEIAKMYEAAVRSAAEELVVDHDTLRQSVGSERDEFVKLSSAVSNWLCNDLFGLWKTAQNTDDGDQGSAIDTTTVDANRLGLLVSLVHGGIVSTPMAKKILAVMYDEEPTMAPQDIADARGWKMITDADELKALCRDVVDDLKNAKQLDQYRQGGRNVQKMGKFFLGKVMAASRGNAHPGLAAEVLEQVLDEAAAEGD